MQKRPVVYGLYIETDTAVDEGASPLYVRHGFNLTGIIPDYALKPHGSLTGTMIYWKKIAA